MRLKDYMGDGTGLYHASIARRGEDGIRSCGMVVMKILLFPQRKVFFVDSIVRIKPNRSRGEGRKKSSNCIDCSVC